MPSLTATEVGREAGRLRFPFTVVGSDRTLTKRFSRGPDGSLHKSPSATLTHGEVRVYWRDSLAALLVALDRLPPSAAVIWGLPRQADGSPVERATVTTRAQRGEGEITRTRECFAWPRGPGILMIDVDGSPADGIPVQEAAVDTWRGLHPAFADVSVAWRPSASSGADGAGIRGQRLYVVVQEASLLEMVAPILNDLQWARGLGRVEITANGHLVRRGFMDATVWRPEWLDFAAPPVLEDGITRERLDSFVCEGARPMVDLARLLPDRERLRQEAEERWRVARLARGEEARAVRRAYIAATGQTWLNHDPLQDEHLGPDFPLLTSTGVPVTVRDLLQDPARWHRTEFHDPYEPDYQQDPRIAVALLQGDYAFPIVYSHAHGGTKYRLFDVETAFAGLEDAPAAVEGVAGREEEEEEEPPRNLPRPLWVDLQAALQARANTLESVGTPTHTSLRAAFDDLRVLTIGGPTGSGKTELMVEQGIENLIARTSKLLVILAVPTKASRGALKRRIRKKMRGRGPLEGLTTLISGRATPTIWDEKTGDLCVRVLLATHATLLQRGDDPADEGRLLQMLDRLVETRTKLGLPPVTVLLCADEGEALIMGLVRSFRNGYRLLTTTDPNTGESVEGVARICVKRCDRCVAVMNETHARTRKSGPAHLEFKIRPEPKNSATMKVPTDALLNALSDERVVTRGVELVRYDLSKLPTDVGLMRELPSVGDDLADLKMGPNPEGILIEAARLPFAYAVRTLPRDREGNLLRPEETAGRDDVIWPKRPCEIWTTLTWDARPLTRLRDLLGAAGRVVFFSATWSQTPLTLVHSVFPGRTHAAAPAGEAQKMNKVLFITVPSLSAAQQEVIAFSKIANTFVVMPTAEEVSKRAEEIMEWEDEDEDKDDEDIEDEGDEQRDRKAPAHNPGCWVNGARDRDVTDKLPNPFFSYARAATGRALNMGHYRIMLVKNNLHASLMDTLGACEHFEDLPLVVETDRRALLIQNMGRIMRQDEDENVLDDRLRVFVYEGLEDQETRQWIDDGGFAVERLKEQVVNGDVQHLILQLNPKRAAEAVRQFLAGEPVTVTDAPGGNAARMSKRERAVSAAARAKVREESAAERDAARQAKLAEALAMAEAGVGWVAARDRLNLRRRFQGANAKTDLEAFKKQFLSVKSSSK